MSYPSSSTIAQREFGDPAMNRGMQRGMWKCAARLANRMSIMWAPGGVRPFTESEWPTAMTVAPQEWKQGDIYRTWRFRGGEALAWPAQPFGMVSVSGLLGEPGCAFGDARWARSTSDKLIFLERRLDECAPGFLDEVERDGVLTPLTIELRPSGPWGLTLANGHHRLAVAYATGLKWLPYANVCMVGQHELARDRTYSCGRSGRPTEGSMEEGMEEVWRRAVEAGQW